MASVTRRQLSGYLIKSRGACQTCRLRHIKCDETKPSCNRCRDDERKCDGYLNLPKSPPRKPQLKESSCPSIPAALPLLPSFDNPLQRDLFASFVSCTADASSLYFGANFWARHVLQLSLSESSIRYALCSLSALRRISLVPPTDPYLTSSNLRHYALQQYNQAVQHTQMLLEESSDGSDDKLVKGLVACALFVCYENFMGNYATANMHLQNGLQIIAKETRKYGHSTIPQDVVQVFKRLDIQAMTFGDAKIPYLVESCKDHIDLLTGPPKGMDSVEDSLDIILRLCRWMFWRQANSDTCPVSPEDLLSAKKVLDRWNREMELYFAIPEIKTNGKFPHPIALLKMYQIIMTIIISTAEHALETLHDTYAHKYEEVITLAESLLLNGRASLSGASSNRFFCFDIGVIFPLFYAAVKLRKPQARRRAVELLGSMRHQEGAWKSSSAAKVAQFVIDVEEEGMSRDDFHIPELARVHLVNTTADVEREEIRVSCVMRSNIDTCSWYTREGWIRDGVDLLPA